MIYFLSVFLIVAFFIFRAGTFTGDMLRYFLGYLGVVFITVFIFANSTDNSARSASMPFLALLGAMLFLPFSFQVIFRLGLPLLETGLGLIIAFIAYSIMDEIFISALMGMIAMWLLSLKTLKIIPIKISLGNYTQIFKNKLD